jgi:hypothetical protein
VEVEVEVVDDVEPLDLCVLEELAVVVLLLLNES